MVKAIDQLRSCAEAAKVFTKGLIGEIAGTVADVIEELTNEKADKSCGITYTILPNFWEIDNEIDDYPFFCDIPVTGLTASDRVDVTIDIESIITAKDCGLFSTSESFDGILRLRAVNRPTNVITIEYWVEQGKE